MTDTSPAKPSRKPLIISAIAIACVIAAVTAAVYLIHKSRYVFTDNAEIAAPLIALGPHQPGILKHVRVHEGDMIHAADTVASVGGENIVAQVDGLVVAAERNIGALYQPGQAVVTMIEPSELRVIARIDEDKGLKDIYQGQQVIFTVDAFGSREFSGVVESISPTKRADDVVFSISDKRETKQFDVKIRYDREEGARLQNGMSARIWIVK